MNCHDARRLLDAYVDLEVDAAAALALEDHLGGCKRCRVEEAAVRATRNAVRAHAPCAGAPDRLRRRLHARYGRRDTGGRVPIRPLLAFPALAALLLAAFVAWFALGDGRDLAGAGQPRVVYHVAQAAAASGALRNLANHLDAAPNAQVVVVAHNNGVEFLLNGARDESGAPYRPVVQALAARGVQFRVCQNTLARQHIDASVVIPEAALVPSGIAEIARLQSEEGYAYMRL